jgi:hypothetical protein
MSTQTDPPPLTDPGSATAAGGSSNAEDRAQQATGQAQEKAQQAAGQAQEKAQQAAGQAHAKVREQLDQRSTQLAEQVHQQASDLRSVSEALRDQGKDRPAEVVDRLAGYGEQAGGYLRDKDADAMLGDAEDFGRQKPAAVAAGALLLGFAASRFLKASSSKRYSTRATQQLPTPRVESPAAAPNPDPPMPATPSSRPSVGSGI